MHVHLQTVKNKISLINLENENGELSCQEDFYTGPAGVLQRFILDPLQLLFFVIDILCLIIF